MAQAQVLSHRLSRDEPSFCRINPSQSSFGADNSFDNTIVDYSMTQPLLHDQFAPEMQTQVQGWPSQRGLAPKYEIDTVAVVDNASEGITRTPGRFYNALDWSNAVTTNPYSTSESNSAFRQNQVLMYPMAGQDVGNKTFNNYLGLSSWASSGSVQGPHGVQVAGSDVDSRSSVSPKSYFSDQISSETTTYSPGQMSNHSPLGIYGYDTSFGFSKESSSRIRIDPSIMASRVPSAKPNFSNTMQNMSYQDGPQHGSGLPVSQSDNTSSSLWRFTGYANDLSALPYQVHSGQSMNGYHSPETSSYLSRGHGRAEQEIASLNKSRATALVQDRQLARSQARVPMDAQAERKVNDQILLRGKKEGLTYKEIRKKMIGDKPAESTLRGRYRALTKERRDRVRKPIWKPKDVELLNEFVQQEFDRIDSTLPSSSIMCLEQKLVKVAWRKVADYISDHGGSYHFGNSTCKRKWIDVHADAFQ